MPPLFGAFVAVVGISVVLFGFDTATGGLVRSYARTLGSLSWGAVAAATRAVDGSGSLASRRSLVEENNSLKEQLALYEEQSARYRALQVQNDALQAMTRLVEEDEGGLTAQVLSSFSTSPYGTFLIGAGEKDGVTRGSIVLTQGGFVLGSVSDVDTHTATVDALFAPGHSVDVVVKSVALTVEGRGGGNASGAISRDADVAVGDAAIVPAFGGRAAGVIGAIESASSSATQTLFLRIPHNLDTLRFVYVIPRQ